jgi:hypothetical protein
LSCQYNAPGGIEQTVGKKWSRYEGGDLVKRYILRGFSPKTRGVPHLRELTKLQSLSLKNTAVTDEGVETLQKAIPNCTISH